MSEEAECREAEPIGPTLKKEYVKSQVAHVRTVETLVALIAFICVQSSVTCQWEYLSDDDRVIIQICKDFNIHSFRFFSAVVMLCILVNIAIYCIHVFSLMDRFYKVPWGLVILIQTGTSSAIILLASAILAGSTYGSHATMAGVALGFLVAIIFGFHFGWELMARQRSALGSSNMAHEGHDGHDNTMSNSDEEVDTTDSDIPTLNSVTLRRHSPEFVPREATDTKTYYVEEKSTYPATNEHITTPNSLSSSSSSFRSEGCLELCDSRPNCNSSGSEDKRSWVITENPDTMSKGDNLSTGNFTVEAGSTYA